MTFKERTAGRKPVIGIIGLGYVGLPLALEFIEGGCSVTGVDVDPGKPQSIEKGESYLRHIPSQRIASAFDTGRFTVSTDFGLLIGGSVASNLILHAHFAGRSSMMDDHHTYFVGMGLTRYWMPSNLYLTGSLGLAGFETNWDLFEPADRELNGTGTGIGASVTVGKEWWVSDNWALGIGVKGSYAFTRKADLGFHDWGVTANFTATLD